TNVTSKVNTAKTEAVNSAVNTSKSYADTKKTEAINSANANTTEKLKSYSTTAQMNSAIQVAKDSITNTVSSTYLSKGDATNTYATKSSLTQTANNIEAKFTSSGGYNLIRNSGFKNGITHWSIHQHNSPTASYGFLESTAEWGFPDSTVRTCQIRYSNQTGKEYGLAQSIATTIGKKYTISVYCASHRLNNANIIVRNTNGSWLANKYFNPESYRGGKTSVSNWGKFTLTFTANATSHTINIVAVNGQNDGYFWIAMPQVTEGEVALPYSQHSQEIYSGSTVIDANGVTINNGALTVKNKSGTPVLRGDSNGNLLYTGALYSQIDSSHYAKLEPILTNNNKDVKLRLSLVGSTEHSNFDVVNASGTSLFKVGHGGVEIHKYLTLDTDQTGTYNTKCYWENGTYRPAVANKALVGTNTYYFNSVLHPLTVLMKTTEDFFENENSNSPLNQAIFERYFFISLYTIWETYTKEIVAKIFVDNEELLNSDEFSFYYYDSIFSSRELKNKLKQDGIRKNLGKIHSEYIFSSNNLWFKRLIDIFKVYGFSINSLECYFSNNVQLKESLNDMRGSSIELTDIHQKVGISLENEAQTTYHSIQLY
ncbi:MAG: HEPN domain-containing protein, partial [Clostridium perfringens]|nr:HEPN domain-containing protein [Clostridium perfringens]